MEGRAAHIFIHMAENYCSSNIGMMYILEAATMAIVWLKHFSTYERRFANDDASNENLIDSRNGNMQQHFVLWTDDTYWQNDRDETSTTMMKKKKNKKKQ